MVQKSNPNLDLLRITAYLKDTGIADENLSPVEVGQLLKTGAKKYAAQGNPQVSPISYGLHLLEGHYNVYHASNWPTFKTRWTAIEKKSGQVFTPVEEDIW